MTGITWLHVAGGVLALLAGVAAVAVRKGSSFHRLAGTGFCASMLVLGITASILAPFKTPPDSPLGGVMACYFVATAWMTARRTAGLPGTFEKIACGTILAIAVATIAEAFSAALSPDAATAGPPGPGALFVFGGLCLFAGLLDLRFIRRGRLSARQRTARHLWRMCFAFFIATGSFFLGQQDVLPEAVRGSPVLFVLAFAPLALMLYWLLRLKLAKRPDTREFVPRGGSNALPPPS